MVVIVVLSREADPDAAAPRLAALIAEEEVVIVCGFRTGAPLLTRLRALLPRFEFLGLVVSCPVAAERVLIESLVSQGSVPVVITPDDEIEHTAQVLDAHLNGLSGHKLDTHLTGIVA